MSEEPPKKKLKTDSNETDEQCTEQTIVDQTFLNQFDDKQRNNMISECLTKLLPLTIIDIIHELSNTHFSDMYVIDAFRDLTVEEFEQFSSKYEIDKNHQFEIPEIITNIQVFGDIVLVNYFGDGIIYIIDEDDKLTNVTTNNSFVIPSRISKHFNNPLLYFAMFNQCSFEIDLSLNSNVLINFISTYLSKFNINKNLITKLHEIGIPNGMQCSLIFRKKSDQKSAESSYLVWNYLAYHPNLRENIKICRQFHLKENNKNIQNQIVLWLRLLDIKNICFTKCKWNTWNKEERNIDLELLDTELSEYGYWTEQSQDKLDNHFIIKGNKDNIKFIKAILDKNKETKKFIVYGQLTVCKYFDEEESVDYTQNEIIFEENKKKPYIIDLSDIYNHWRIYLTEYYEDRCIVLLEGPLHKIDEAITRIYKLNNKGFVSIYSDKRIGCDLQFLPTSLRR